MKRLNGKTLILWIMTLVLCVTTCMPAFASVGDRTLLRGNNSGMVDVYVSGVFPLEDGFCLVINGNDGLAFQKYATPQSEPETYKMPGWGTSDDTEVPEDVLNSDEMQMVPGEKPEDADAAAVPEENARADESTAPEESKEETDFFADLDWASEDDNGVVINNDADGEASEGMDASNYSYANTYFGWNNEIYGLVYNYKTDDENPMGKLESGTVKHVKLENGEIILEDCDIPELDISFMASDSDDGAYYSADSAFTTGDYLVLRYYNGMGQTIGAINLKDGVALELDAADSLSNDLFAGPAGSVLTSEMDWTMDGVTFKLKRIDLATKQDEPYTEIKGSGYSLAATYDQATDTFFYIQDGEVYAQKVADGQKAESVNECAFNPDGLQVVPGGYIIAWNYNTAVARNTDPTQRAKVTLRVSNTGSNYYLTDSVFAMNETQGDMSVVLKTEDNSLKTDVIQAMMNQDDNIDVYILENESKAFNALRNRGYLTDLSDNKDIVADVERMYPYLQEAIKQDGKIIGIPVQVGGQMLGVNPKTWAKLGGTEEELPKTWGQFLDWLEKDVPERISGTEIKVSDDVGYSFKGELRMMLLYQYQVWMDSKGEEYQFNTPLLKDLMTRIKNLDTEALGMKEDYEEMGGYVVYGDEDEDQPLIQTYNQPTVGGCYNGSEPLTLSFDENEAPIISSQIYVGFVNPYSKHPEEAKKFLSLILKNMNEQFNATLFTDKAEPIRAANADEMMEGTREWVEQLEKQLAEAEEGETSAELEENLKWARRSLENMDRWSWIVHPDDLATYQKLLPNLKVMDYLFLYDMFNTSDREELMEVQMMFYSDETDPEQLLEMLDNKLQTIRKEGN